MKAGRTEDIPSSSNPQTFQEAYVVGLTSSGAQEGSRSVNEVTVQSYIIDYVTD